jgi:hypothetical protein
MSYGADERPRGYDEQQLRAWRDMIREAVSNEFAAQVGPLRQELARVGGKVEFHDRDFALLKERVDELSEVLLGNDRTRTKGLVTRVDELSKTLAELNTRIEAWTNQVRGAKIAFAILAMVSSVPAIQVLAKLFGFIP